jgi:hypothetical protein
MNDAPASNRRSQVKTGRVAAALLRRLRVLVLALPFLPALAAAQANPRLSNLRIEIWPEFDRQAVLVILRGELSPDMTLPSEVTLRIPASAGAPAAVAFANAGGSELFNLKHEVTRAGNYSAVRFAAPQRFFHVEYYDPIVTASSVRNYTYVWPGDFSVDRLNVMLQEPVTASDVTTVPDLGPGTPGGDGLNYRALDVGAYKAGSDLSVAIRYAKPDSRTSAEILKIGTPAAKPPPPAAAAPTESYPAWVPLAATLLGLSVGVPVFLWLWRRRKAASGARPAAAGFCTRCGKALGAADRYCSACGAQVRKK